jgi:DNA-binding NtrC family response regulator
MKLEICQDINNSIQQYFRASKRVRINGREGVYVVVDDRQEAIDLIKRLFESRNLGYEIVGAKNVEEAKKEINLRNKGQDVKAVVIDLGLEGKGHNADGLNLAKWLEEEHNDIPYIISTGKSKRRVQIERQLPGVDVFIKGQNSIDDLAEALGLNIDTAEEESEVIPRDINVEQESEGFVSIFKNLFSLSFLF